MNHPTPPPGPKGDAPQNPVPSASTNSPETAEPVPHGREKTRPAKPYTFREQLADAFHYAPATCGLIALNLLVALAMALSGVDPMFPSTSAMIDWGAEFGLETLDGQPWRLLTATFLHYGLLHLALNMWALWCGGPVLERMLRPLPFLVIYLTCGLLASTASLGYSVLTVGAGASGAIFGVFGAIGSYLVVNRKAMSRTNRLRIKRWMISAILPNLALGFMIPFVDNAAHLGGFIAGLAGGALLGALNPGHTHHMRRAVGFAAAGAGLIALVFIWLGNPVGELSAGEDAAYNRDFTAARERLGALTQRLPQWEEPWRVLGKVYTEQGNFNAAEAAFNRALQAAPGDPETIDLYAGVVARQGDVRRGALLIGVQMQTHSDESIWWYLRARYSARYERNPRQAVALLGRCLQIDPVDTKALVLRAVLHGMLGNQTELQRDSDALRKTPDYATVLSELAERAMDEEDYRLALHATTLGVLEFPGAAGFLSQRGFACYALGLDDQAELDWRGAARLVAQDPTAEASVLENIALVHLKREDWTAARQQADESLQKNPGLGWSALFLALAASRQGDTAQAEQAFARWVELATPQDRWYLNRLLPAPLKQTLQTLSAKP